MSFGHGDLDWRGDFGFVVRQAGRSSAAPYNGGVRMEILESCDGG